MPDTIPPEAIDHAVEQVEPIVERVADDLVAACRTYPHQEVKSAQLVMDVLEEQGFELTSRGTSGIPTAFIAEWGSGEPVLGFLAEYDALPGLGNQAVPHKAPRQDGGTSGHGCGHNLLGAGTIGAAIALKQVMAEQGVSGTLRVYGCAAEETEGAKIYMARDGLFNDLDAALHWHPNSKAQVTNIRSAAVNALRIEFFGKTAHAGMSPWLGRSAIHATELFLHGVNLMREHVEPTARIHYIVEDGGLAPNIVPDYTRVKLFVRDVDREHVEANTEWLKQIADGAALATQTRAETLGYNGMYDLLPNNPLAERLQTHMERIGVPSYSDDELTFARELQQNFGVEQAGMTTAPQPLPPDGTTMGASTDVADVSWLTPTMGCGMPTMPLGVSVHTWAATASHGTIIGKKGAVHAMKALALLGADLVTDADLRQAARADFEQRTNGKGYTSPLAPDMKRPLSLEKK